MDRLVRLLEGFFSSFRFPLMTLSVMISMEVLLGLMLVIPSSAGSVGAFAEEFRVWCFGYDAATGQMEMGYVVMLLAHPPVLGGITLLVWYRPLKEALRARPGRLLPYVGSALAIVFSAGLLLVSLGSEARATELPFPAETLRMAQPAPEFTLTDQSGAELRLADLRGRVTVVTGVYATCGHTCPLILGQAKRAIAALDQERRAGVTFVAITLDPERDDTGVLQALARREGVSAPAYRFLTGPPAAVNEVLDALDITRKKDPHSGVIDHANLFLLYDKQGKLAYRLTLGERQERWLVQALQVLLVE